MRKPALARHPGAATVTKDERDRQPIPPAENAAPWLQGEPGRWRIQLAVQPGAAHTRVLGLFDGCLKLQIKAPPIEGRANEAVIAWLAERLSLKRSAIQLTGGERSRRKHLALDSPLSAEALSALLYQGERP